jgi:hypothetical protein
MFMNEQLVAFVYDDGNSQKVTFLFNNRQELFEQIGRFLEPKLVEVKSIVFI